MYGSVYIDGLAKEIEDSRRESIYSKHQAGQAKKQLEAVKNDNMKLNALLKRYRKMVVEQQKMANFAAKFAKRSVDSASSFYTGKKFL